ncbi:hypothetical protein K9L97_05760 [Candidatus Woesearchaeota archaeon]|nr:hypothetical protein [Candidatus Woesearchaeota archaeon]
MSQKTQEKHKVLFFLDDLLLNTHLIEQFENDKNKIEQESQHSTNETINDILETIPLQSKRLLEEASLFAKYTLTKSSEYKETINIIKGLNDVLKPEPLINMVFNTGRKILQEQPTKFFIFGKDILQTLNHSEELCSMYLRFANELLKKIDVHDNLIKIIKENKHIKTHPDTYPPELAITKNAGLLITINPDSMDYALENSHILAYDEQFRKFLMTKLGKPERVIEKVQENILQYIYTLRIINENYKMPTEEDWETKLILQRTTTTKQQKRILLNKEIGHDPYKNLIDDFMKIGSIKTTEYVQKTYNENKVQGVRLATKIKNMMDSLNTYEYYLMLRRDNLAATIQHALEEGAILEENFLQNLKKVVNAKPENFDKYIDSIARNAHIEKQIGQSLSRLISEAILTNAFEANSFIDNLSEVDPAFVKEINTALILNESILDKQSFRDLTTLSAIQLYEPPYANEKLLEKIKDPYNKKITESINQKISLINNDGQHTIPEEEEHHMLGYTKKIRINIQSKQILTDAIRYFSPLISHQEKKELKKIARIVFENQEDEISKIIEREKFLSDHYLNMIGKREKLTESKTMNKQLIDQIKKSFTKMIIKSNLTKDIKDVTTKKINKINTEYLLNEKDLENTIELSKNKITAYYDKPISCISKNGSMKEKGYKLLQNKHTLILEYKNLEETILRAVMHEAIIEGELGLYISTIIRENEDRQKASSLLPYEQNVIDSIIEVFHLKNNYKKIFFNLDPQNNDYYPNKFAKDVAEKIGLKKDIDYTYKLEKKNKPANASKHKGLLFTPITAEWHPLTILINKPNVELYVDGVRNQPRHRNEKDHIKKNEVSYAKGIILNKTKI